MVEQTGRFGFVMKMILQYYISIDDDDVYHYIGERPKLERGTENMCG